MQRVLAGLRPYLLFAGLFSFAMNLLLLAPPLYMLQVFDRVLTSRSGETQPLTATWNPAGYMRNVVETVKVVAV